MVMLQASDLSLNGNSGQQRIYSGQGGLEDELQGVDTYSCLQIYAVLMDKARVVVVVMKLENQQGGSYGGTRSRSRWWYSWSYLW